MVQWEWLADVFVSHGKVSYKRFEWGKWERRERVRREKRWKEEKAALLAESEFLTLFYTPYLYPRFYTPVSMPPCP